MSARARGSEDASPPGDAGAIQTRFATMFSRVPDSVRKLIKGESSLGGVGMSSTWHSYYVVVEDMEATCCGKIGNSGKVCIRGIGGCDIQKHVKARHEGLDAGIYIRGNTEDEVYAFPSIALADLSEDARQDFLSCKVESLEAAKQKIDEYNSSVEGKVKLFDYDKESRKASAEFMSPVAKRAKINLIERTEELLQHSPTRRNLLKSENPEYKTIIDAFGRRDLLLKLLSTSVVDNQEELESMLEKMVDITGQMGVAPRDGPPALWLGILELREEFRRLKEQAEDAIPPNFFTSYNVLEGRVNILTKSLEEAKTETREALVDLAGALVNPPAGINQGGNLGSSTMREAGGEANANETPYDFILDRLDTLTDQCNAISRAASSSANAIKVGKHCFESVDELSGWCERHLPPEFPFGAFVDIYSFLQRIKSFRDRTDPDSLKSMDYRDRLDLTADEAITLDAFAHPLPKGFRGTSSEEGQMSSWLPGLKQADKWEDKSETIGVKVMIKENIEVVRTRVLAVIRHRLANHPEASALARELLADTIAFLTEFSEFISSTFRTLKLAGFEKTSAWNLVSKLIHRILAVDCFLKRGISFELLDAKEHKALAVSVLWGTFGTHQVLRGYQQHSIENHPSMASEYVRFLVAHTDATKMSLLEQRAKTLEASCKKSDGEVRRLEKEVEGQKRSITTANNKIDDLQKAVKKLQSN